MERGAGRGRSEPRTFGASVLGTDCPRADRPAPRRHAMRNYERGRCNTQPFGIGILCKELPPVESVAEPREKTLLPRLELPGRLLLAAELRQLAQELFLLGVQAARRFHGDVDHQVAAAGAVEVPDAEPVQRDDLARLRAGADVHVVRAVERLHGDGGAERRRHHRDRQRAVQVVALPFEYRVRALHDLEEQVAGRSAAGPRLAFAGELDVRAVLDAGRDPHLHGPPGAHPAVAVALRTGAGQDRAVAAAVRAGLGGDHLAEEGAPHLADLAASRADLAGLRVGARCGALTGTGRADHGGVHGQLAGRAERALRQVELDPDRGVPAAPCPRARSAGGGAARGAEHRVDEVAEREAGRRAETAEASARARPGERIAAQVVHLALFRVPEDLVGLGDLLELLLRVRIRVDVRVQFAGQAAVRALDLGLRGVAADSEQCVIVLSHYDSPRICPTYRATARTAPIVPG